MKIRLSELRSIIKEEVAATLLREYIAEAVTRSREEHLSNLALHFHGAGKLDASDVEFIKSDPTLPPVSSGKMYRGLRNTASMDFTAGRDAGVYEESGVFKNVSPAESWTTDIKIAKEFGVSNVAEVPGIVLYADASENPGVFYDSSSFVSAEEFKEDIGGLEESEVLALGPVKYYAIEVLRPTDSGDPLEAVMRWGKKKGLRQIMPSPIIHTDNPKLAGYYRDEKGKRLLDKGYYEYLVDADNVPLATWTTKDLKAGKVLYHDGERWAKRKIADLP